MRPIAPATARIAVTAILMWCQASASKVMESRLRILTPGTHLRRCATAAPFRTQRRTGAEGRQGHLPLSDQPQAWRHPMRNREESKAREWKPVGPRQGSARNPVGRLRVPSELSLLLTAPVGI